MDRLTQGLQILGTAHTIADQRLTAKGQRLVNHQTPGLTVPGGKHQGIRHCIGTSNLRLVQKTQWMEAFTKEVTKPTRPFLLKRATANTDQMKLADLIWRLTHKRIWNKQQILLRSQSPGIEQHRGLSWDP